MSRDNDGVLELIQRHLQGQYGIPRHSSGVPLVGERWWLSRSTRGHDTERGRPSCAVCHDYHRSAQPQSGCWSRRGASRPGRRSDPPRDDSDHERGPLCKRRLPYPPRFRTDLGFLQAEYSLQEVDALISGLNTSFVVAALCSHPARHHGSLDHVQADPRPTASIHAFRDSGDRRQRSCLPIQDRSTTTNSAWWKSPSTTWPAESRLIRAELRDAREYLEAIVENSADIIITVNPEGLIQTVNRGAEQALGYQREELIGEPIELLFADPREREVAIARLRAPGQCRQLRDALPHEEEGGQERPADLVPSARPRRSGPRHHRHQQGHHGPEAARASSGAIRKGRGHRSGGYGDSACHQEHVEHADWRLLPGASRLAKQDRELMEEGDRDDRRGHSDNRESLRRRTC